MSAIVSPVALGSDGEERLARVMRLLGAVGRALDVDLDDRSVVVRAAEALLPDFACACAVDVVDPLGVLRRAAALHSDLSRVPLVEALFTDGSEDSPTVRALATGRAIVWLDLDDAPPAIRRALASLDARSVMVVPASARDRVVAIVMLLATDARPVFDAFDLALARDFASRIALSLEHARSYDRVREDVRSRDDLVAAVSHDLRDPLGAIGAGASVLRQVASPGDVPVARAIELVARNVQRMQKLVGNLLDLSRHDSAGLGLDPGEHALRNILYDTFDTLGPLAAQKRLQLEARMPAELPLVRCDPDAMVRVLTNLVSNAVKFTPSGGAIRVRVEPQEHDLRVAVSDTGPGIARADVPHIFDRYWQARRASRSGAGLGLSIAKAIIEQTGGTIWVDSHVGVGTTFYFTVPVAQSC